MNIAGVGNCFQVQANDHVALWTGRALCFWSTDGGDLPELNIPSDLCVGSFILLLLYDGLMLNVGQLNRSALSHSSMTTTHTQTLIWTWIHRWDSEEKRMNKAIQLYTCACMRFHANYSIKSWANGVCAGFRKSIHMPVSVWFFRAKTKQKKKPLDFY